MPNPSKDGGTSIGIGIASLGWKRSSSPLQIPNTLLEDQDQDQDQGGQSQSICIWRIDPSTTTFSAGAPAVVATLHRITITILDLFPIFTSPLFT
ncbi:hypothetical protein V865_002537 [Kwoniella europaea PYCC6329]|uniref:Uncharacterized protein n=1 Tax=Kwoniella europaea PYCC6329 TaxID=1423913 RepID=A0AAX4KEK6_9TREE